VREPSLELLPSRAMSDAPSDAPSFDAPASPDAPTDGSSDALVVLCTVPDEPTAERLARGIVEARLAACVNVLGGVRSFYRWKGAIQDDRELQLVIKTRRARFEALATWLAREHPYEVPEVLALPVVVGASSYLRWLCEQVAEPVGEPRDALLDAPSDPRNASPRDA
jgi:periplasmic divalent cation tolerance protein